MTSGRRSAKKKKDKMKRKGNKINSSVFFFLNLPPTNIVRL